MSFKQYSKSQILIIILLILFMLMQEIFGMLNNSVTLDEMCYVGAGKAIFSTGYMGYMLMIFHPPLAYYLSSIFLIPLKFDEKIWQNSQCLRIGHDVLFESQYDPDKILFMSRLPFIFLSIILAIYVLKWSTELYGKKSGLIAVFLYSFSPSIIAYSGLATLDFTVAAMIFIATYYFWKLIKEQSKKNIILTGLFLGFALLSKVTAIILIPLFIIVGLISYYRNGNLKLKNLIIIFLISFTLILLFYKFQFGTLSNSIPIDYYNEKTKSELSKVPYVSNYLLYIYDNVPVPVPSYFRSMGNIFYLSVQQKYHFIFGNITNERVWYFAILTFILKTNVSLLIMIALIFILSKKIIKADLMTSLILALPILFIFIVFSISNKIAGINHIMAVYPFIFVLTSNLINARIKRKNLLHISIAFLLFSYGLSTLMVSPHYLSYFNILSGGPANAYKIMVGANIDQGQELHGLKKFMEENKINKINLSYWGSADPSDYKINYDYMPSPQFQPWLNNYSHIAQESGDAKEDCSPRKGLIAISVTNLQNVHLINKACYNWLKDKTPMEKIGYSIFIYDSK